MARFCVLSHAVGTLLGWLDVQLEQAIEEGDEESSSTFAVESHVETVRESFASSLREGRRHPFDEPDPEPPRLCSRDGCEEVATHRVVFVIRESKGGPPAGGPSTVVLCPNHLKSPEKLKSELLAPGFSKIAAQFQALGYASPRLKYSEVVLEPIGGER